MKANPAIKTSTRRITKRQWDRYIPVSALAVHLRAIATALDSVVVPGNEIRGKILVTMELAAPLKKRKGKAVKRG